jgi:diguanylate cyclase (GGDEF)-like protein
VFSHSPRTLPALALLVWTVFAALAAVLSIEQDVRDARMEFAERADAEFQRVARTLDLAEVVVQGFVASLDAVGAGAIARGDYVRTARYARRVMEERPEVYAIEVVRRLPLDSLDDPTAYPTHPPLNDLRIKTFNYDSDRSWRPVDRDRRYYYPIVFLEPVTAQTIDIVGLDVDSVPFLARTLEEAAVRRAPVAGAPFELVEGPLAFAVFAPSGVPGRPVDGAVRYAYPLYAEVIVLVDQLLDAAGMQSFDGALQVLMDGLGEHSEPKRLVRKEAQPASRFEALFPRFTFERAHRALGRSFVVSAERASGWADVRARDLLLIGGVALATFVLLLLFSRAHHRNELARLDREAILFRMANFDPLTELPNRHLLMDRLQSSIRAAERRGQRMAVLFGDLDGFKEVNDTHGHAGGDAALQVIAGRLGGCLRAGDTVARLAGDEFVICMPAPASREDAEVVARKIQEALRAPIALGPTEVRLGISIGVAVFPGDGDRAEALLRAADRDMYEQKHGR